MFLYYNNSIYFISYSQKSNPELYKQSSLAKINNRENILTS